MVIPGEATELLPAQDELDVNMHVTTAPLVKLDAE
jgi:hypothetical protein